MAARFEGTYHVLSRLQQICTRLITTISTNMRRRELIDFL